MSPRTFRGGLPWRAVSLHSPLATQWTIWGNEDVFKTSSLKTKPWRLKNRISVAKWRPPRPQLDVIKTSWKRAFGVFFEVSKRAQNVLIYGIQNVLRTSLLKDKSNTSLGRPKNQSKTSLGRPKCHNLNVHGTSPGRDQNVSMWFSSRPQDPHATASRRASIGKQSILTKQNHKIHTSI